MPTAFALACGVGLAGAIHVARLGLTLSHYDARAHLVVARRVFDSLTPGWRQLGGLWLPLPHLLNLPFVWWNWNYRTGATAVAWSILVLAAGLASLAGYLERQTRSAVVAVTIPLAILANPNVLYLQGTPMTEPLLLGFSFLALTGIDAWVSSPDAKQTARAGWRLAALVLVRYEGWLIAAGLVAVAAIAVRARGLQSLIRLVTYPAVALAAFLVLSWASTGTLFTTSGFYVPNNPALDKPLEALREVRTITQDMAGPVLLAGAAAGLLVCLVRARTSLASLLPVALVAAGALPLGAFQEGHPERVRYMVPLIAAGGALTGFACAAVPAFLRPAAGLAVLALALVVRPPFSSDAPMVVEAQWERPFSDARQNVTRYLRESYDGTPILASMASLGHYMQQTSAIGLNVRNFLHEGNGDLWLDALQSPRRHVEWVLIEEQARGGDVLAQRARSDPAFLAGFSRVAEGGGVELYRRN